MDYFRILDLEREPFSNSPDPDFFFQSAQHTGCLQQLELAIRLRRGLNVVIGHVGTGKTTLCRELIRRFNGEKEMTTVLMLDPGSGSEGSFLSGVWERFAGQAPPEDWSDERKKEAIKRYLFKKGVEENQTTVLIIDEGQKITPACLEILREFLNFETNTHKLLQIVIFAQQEFVVTLDRHPNLADRINLRVDLHPLSLPETVALIRYRIQVSGGAPANRLFSLPAMVAIYWVTGGYPRKIFHLCHRILLTLIIQNRRQAGWRLVRASARRNGGYRPSRGWQWIAATGAAATILGIFFLFPSGWLGNPPVGNGTLQSTGAPPPESPVLSDTQPPAAIPSHTADAPTARPPAPLSAAPVNLAPGPASAIAAERPDIDRRPPPRDAVARPMPARLGRLAIAPRETLGQLIQMVYGRFTPAYLEAIAEANPHIADPNQLEVGDVVHFPALPAAVRSLPVPVWWVQLDTYGQLDQAVLALKQNRQEGLEARMIPYWNHDQGLVFAVVLADCFYDRQIADKALMQADSPGTATAAAVRSLWRDDTVFFCDPFRGVPGHPARPS